MATISGNAGSGDGLAVHPSQLGKVPPPTLGGFSLLAEEAACRFDPELHLGPAQGESDSERAVREQVAAEVCADCPVWDLCLFYALRVRPLAGVWVGLPSADLCALHPEVDAPTHPAGVA